MITKKTHIDISSNKKDIRVRRRLTKSIKLHGTCYMSRAQFVEAPDIGVESLLCNPVSRGTGVYKRGQSTHDANHIYDSFTSIMFYAFR